LEEEQVRSFIFLKLSSLYDCISSYFVIAYLLYYTNFEEARLTCTERMMMKKKKKMKKMKKIKENKTTMMTMSTLFLDVTFRVAVASASSPEAAAAAAEAVPSSC